MRILFSLLSIFLPTFLLAQDYVDLMMEGADFQRVQKAFNQQWQGKSYEKGKGIKAFRRWEYFMETRLAKGENQLNSQALWEASERLRQQKSANIPQGNWSFIGPANRPTNTGLGRVNTVAFHPTDTSIMWIGSPSGGLWKTTDNGASWTTDTDDYPSLGVSALRFNLLQPNKAYLCSGDRDAGDTYSYGLLISNDTGKTWNTSGLSFNINQKVRCNDVWAVGNNVAVVANDGIYFSSDGGSSFNKVQAGNFTSLVPKIDNPSALIATRYSPASTYYSSDGGATWVERKSGLPSTDAKRIAVSSVPGQVEHLVAVVSNNNHGFKGFFYSTDFGLTWTEKANSPNLLGWEVDGSDEGGQGWYDLAIAAKNENEIWVGGVNIWKTLDGGSNWGLHAHWYGGGGKPYVHADQHYFVKHPYKDELLIGNDGGLYRYKLQTDQYTDISDGLAITQYYRLSTSPFDTLAIMGGAQDNGTAQFKSGNWNRVYGGDGMECLYSRTDPNVIFACSQYGNIQKSTNGGASFTSIRPTSEKGAWITPYEIDPENGDILYAGYDKLYRTTNGGSSWTEVYDLGGTKFNHIAIAPSQTSVVYASSGSLLIKSTDGVSFSPVTSPGFSITDIAIHSFDPNTLWVTTGGYGSVHVKKSVDGGQTWANVTDDLPSIPANTILHDATSINNGVYVGTDLGVYMTNDTIAGWLPFSQGLPNVIVSELEINYTDKKIRAATYGRGMWISPIPLPPKVYPLAKFTINRDSVCVNGVVNFTNESENNPDSYLWEFNPPLVTFVNGTNANSSNPMVKFDATGYYSVTLTASLNGLEHSIVKNSLINVVDEISGLNLDINDGADTLNFCNGEAVDLYFNSSDFDGILSADWGNGFTGETISTSLAGTYPLLVQDGLACYYRDTVVLNQNPSPSVNITFVPNIIRADTSDGAIGVNWYLDNVLIPGAEGDSLIPSDNGTYYALAINALGCEKQSNKLSLSGLSLEEDLLENWSLYPNPNQGSWWWKRSVDNGPAILRVFNAMGQTIYQETIEGNQGWVVLPHICGIYLVQISDSEGLKSHSLIVD